MIRYLNNKTKQGFSLTVILLIVFSLLVGALTTAGIVIRYLRITRGVELSEKAYFCAESVLEAAAYDLLRSYSDVSSYSLSGTYDNCDYSTESVSVDTNNPNTGNPITNTAPWSITLSPGQSFQLDLDINGTAYPATLQISRSGSVPSDLIVYECTTESNPRVCSETMSQTLYTTFPQTLSIDESSKYYKIKIINRSASDPEIYTLTPSTDAALPIGIKVQASGTYGGYKRYSEINLQKWHKYGI